MFLVCDPIVWGLEHVPFNAALLKTIRIAFPHDIIYFYGEDSHLEHVQKYLGFESADPIIWKTLALPPRHSSYFSRFHIDFKTIRFLLNELNKKPGNNVLVITGKSSILWALKFFINTIHKDKNIQVILHGTLASLGSRRSLKPHKRIWNIRAALEMFNHRQIQYLVLEESIKDAVLEKLPFLYKYIGVFDHPIPLDEEAEGTNNFSPPIKFGFLGLANEQKGFTKYLTVASEISSQFPGFAEFHVIGRLGNQYKNLHIAEMNFLSTKPGTERLSRDEYGRRLKNLHFVCLFYDRYYKFSPSGALMDCIAWEKPIIATKQPIFENLENNFGDIGYLCKNGEFTQVIKTILKEKNPVRYDRQVQNLHNVKTSRTPESLAKKYRELVERFKLK